jgi:hypothetical protein
MRIPIWELVQISKGGRDAEKGTWIHPQVVIHFAEWVNPIQALAESTVIPADQEQPAGKRVQIEHRGWLRSPTGIVYDHLGHTRPRFTLELAKLDLDGEAQILTTSSQTDPDAVAFLNSIEFIAVLCIGHLATRPTALPSV